MIPAFWECAPFFFVYQNPPELQISATPGPHSEFLFSVCMVRQNDAAAWRPWLEDLCCGKLRCKLFLVRGHSRCSPVCLSLVLFFPASFLHSRRKRGHALYSITSRGFYSHQLCSIFDCWVQQSRNICSRWDHLQTWDKAETLKAFYMIPRHTGWG